MVCDSCLLTGYQVSSSSGKRQRLKEMVGRLLIRYSHHLRISHGPLAPLEGNRGGVSRIDTRIYCFYLYNQNNNNTYNMSEAPDPPGNTGNKQRDATIQTRATEAKQKHTAKFDTAAEGILKEYGKVVEIEGMTVSAIFDAMVVLRHMVKTELRPTKPVSARQHRTVNNIVNMLEAWMDLNEYRANQDALAMANLMNNNFKSLQESSNTLKTASGTHNNTIEATNEQLQELKRSVGTLQTLVEDLRTSIPQPTPSQPTSQTRPLSYAEATSKPSPFTDPCHADIVAKAKLADWRISVKPQTDTAKAEISKLTEKDLIRKMNEELMLAAMSTTDNPYEVPEEHKAVGARKLANGGVAYMFNSDGAAAWLREAGSLDCIQQAAGEGTVISLQLNNTIR
ncbi:hypothetical protein EV421DRAFT_1738407 [Armillaria borealis]|uniref:Uncharacterized protein n=1 Tax=Armillaria borealis TaxID=47425 RepID=A0AA39J9I6_9AGAR|nr:hypothetical protein EV421DRAFT_1738407 [Armillaria borealis]